MKIMVSLDLEQTKKRRIVTLLVLIKESGIMKYSENENLEANLSVLLLIRLFLSSTNVASCYIYTEKHLQ